MPEQLHATVIRKTTIDYGYRRHAAHQSMSVFLADWEKAHAELGNRIEVLRKMRDTRQAEQSDGRWPYPNPPGSGERATPGARLAEQG